MQHRHKFEASAKSSQSGCTAAHHGRTTDQSPATPVSGHTRASQPIVQQTPVGVTTPTSHINPTFARARNAGVPLTSPFNLPSEYDSDPEDRAQTDDDNAHDRSQQHASMSSTSSSSDEATVRFTSRDDSVTFLEESERECEGMNRTKPNDAKLIRHALKCCRKKERKTARNWWEQLDGEEIAEQPPAADGEYQVPLKS